MDYNEFCSLFTDDVPKATRLGDRYYLIGEDLAGFKSGEQRKPYSVGLYLGMGRNFVPTAALLTLLAKTSTRKAVLKDDKTEWLFVCARDIFHDGFSSELQEGFVLVQNKRDENLGFGKVVAGKEGPLLKNILDRGNYLRHEKVTL